MNLIDVIDIIEPYYDLIFHVMVVILAFFVWRAIKSVWSKDVDISQKYQFKRGEAEYRDPARPHSKSFTTYMQLALVTTYNSQLELVEKLSDRLNETNELHILVSKKDLSPNLSLLMEDPEEWLKKTQKKVSSTKMKRRKLSSDILYEEIFKILKEVNSLYDVQILPKLE